MRPHYAKTCKADDHKQWQCTNPKCGKWHTLSGYVYAHYREELTATCDGCGTKHTTQLGQVWRQDNEHDSRR